LLGYVKQLGHCYPWHPHSAHYALHNACKVLTNFHFVLLSTVVKFLTSCGGSFVGNYLHIEAFFLWWR